ncbi:hypothetical protein JCM11641_001642 [Rhodosporidiobolus odoratus]
MAFAEASTSRAATLPAAPPAAGPSVFPPKPKRGNLPWQPAQKILDLTSSDDDVFSSALPLLAARASGAGIKGKGKAREEQPLEDANSLPNRPSTSAFASYRHSTLALDTPTGRFTPPNPPQATDSHTLPRRPSLFNDWQVGSSGATLRGRAAGSKPELSCPIDRPARDVSSLPRRPPPLTKRRARPSADVTFGDPPPCSVAIERGTKMALTKYERGTFSKSTPSHKMPLFPPQLPSRIIMPPKAARAPVEFKPVEELNEARRQAVLRQRKEERKEQKKQIVLRSDDDDPFDPLFDSDDDSNDMVIESPDPTADPPLASTSKARPSPVDTSFKAAVGPSSSPASSPNVTRQPKYSSAMLQRRLQGADDYEDDENDEILVRARRGGKPKAGHGKGRLPEGKKRKEREEPRLKVKKGKARAEKELWTDLEGTRVLEKVKVPAGWRPASPPQRLAEPPPQSSCVEVTVREVVFRSTDSRGDIEGDWRIELYKLDAMPSSAPTLLDTIIIPAILPPSPSSNLPDGFSSFTPLATLPSGTSFGPFPLAPPGKLRLTVQLVVGTSSFDISYTLPSTTLAVSTPITFDGTLPFENDELPLGMRVKISAIPSFTPLVSSPSEHLDTLSADIDNLLREREPQDKVWLPDGIEVRLEGEEEGDIAMMPKGKRRLQLDRAGYDFLTKEPYENGEYVQAFTHPTIERASGLLQQQDERIALSSQSAEEAIIPRLQSRMALINPFPPSTFLREIATWRHFAPVLHHFHLRDRLSLHLVELLKTRLLTSEEILAILRAYDLEAQKVQRKERMDYKEWKRRALWVAQQKQSLHSQGG